MDSFFFERKQARTFIYVFIFIVWLTILLVKASSPTLKQVIFTIVGYPLVGLISYFFMKLSLSSIYLFTKKIGVYQLIYWYGLFCAFICLGTMILPKQEMYGEASLMVIVCVAITWVSRSAYFDYKEIMRNS